LKSKRKLVSGFIKPRQLHYVARSHVDPTQQLTAVLGAVLFTSASLKRSSSVPYLFLTATEKAGSFGYSISKGRAMPLQAWTGPEGSMRLRL
jgi:hypothetical protein